MNKEALADRWQILDKRAWRLYIINNAATNDAKTFIRSQRLLIKTERKIKIIERLLRWK
ncbi:hypothetical protein ABDK00_014130 [Niabella insulamsoli]|uniref:hypothetical protein n=1 Tax=Niabella insulamsoli TaxID=3144874 RepID=UPI0031FC3525